MSAEDLVRLFVLFRDEKPIAAQYWALSGRRATVLKLAHVSESDRLSTGTVLTALAIETLLDREGVVELDFGRGDDEYKRAWASERRQRTGIMAYNPRALAGASGLLRHELGRLSTKWRTGVRRP